MFLLFFEYANGSEEKQAHWNTQENELSYII